MSENKEKKVSIGGQALIEGIMMQGPKGAAMSVRLPSGEIETEMLEVKKLKDKFKPAGWPLIRGIVNMVESLTFGFKCIEKSAEKAGLDDDNIPEEEMSKLDKWLSDHFGPKMIAVISGIAMVLGLGLSFLLFVYLPTFLVDIVDKYLFKEALSNLHPLFEDIKRVFMYHGAEHKSIFCYEAGLELTVENVKKQSRFHPRCGTSFIFVVLIISIFISSVLVVLFPTIDDIRPLWIAIKLLIVPITVALSYEFIKYAGSHDNVFVKILSFPGLMMQRISTKEPTDDIIEVGIASIKAVLPEYSKEKEDELPESNTEENS